MKASFLMFGLGKLWAISPVMSRPDDASASTNGMASTSLVMNSGLKLKLKLLSQTKPRLGSRPTLGLGSEADSERYMAAMDMVELSKSLYCAAAPNRLFFSGMKNGAYSKSTVTLAAGLSA